MLGGESEQHALIDLKTGWLYMWNTVIICQHALDMITKIRP